MNKRVAFRTKGNHAQGMGDVSGSVALAGEFRRAGCEVVFVLDNDFEAVDAVGFAGFSFHTVDAGSEAEVWNRVGAVDTAVVNQLNSGVELLSIIKHHAGTLVTIDDVGEPSRRLADLRINPLYYDEGALCDPCYVPLNDAFRSARISTGPAREKVEQLLVTLGGSDTYGFTPVVVKFLDDVPEDIFINVLVGPSFRHHAELRGVLDKSKRRFNLLGPVDPAGMCGLISWADMVVCSGGNTMFECACLGRAAVVVCAEPFEVETAGRLDEAGMVVNTGFGALLKHDSFLETVTGLIADPVKRASMAEKGFTSVDGRGTERIFSKIISAWGN